MEFFIFLMQFDVASNRYKFNSIQYYSFHNINEIRAG